MTGKIKLPHASGNSMSIAAPATNPASDLELKLPATIGSAGQLLKNSGTAGTLEFSNGLTYDGTDLTLGAGRAKLTDESSGAQLRIGAAGDFQIEHDASNTYLANTTGDLVFQNDANVKITAKTGGTQRFRFDSDGLKFGSDTAAANAFSDYEEGTFTAGIANGTVNSVNARYTKIGNQVIVQISVNTFSDHTSGNSIEINGLPFTSESNNFSTGSCITAYINNNGAIVPYITGGVTRIRFLTFASGGDYGLVLHSAIAASDSSRRIFLTISYEAA